MNATPASVSSSLVLGRALGENKEETQLEILDSSGIASIMRTFDVRSGVKSFIARN